MSDKGVHQSVDRGEWKIVFVAGFIQIREVDAHSPLSASLFYHNNIGEPIRIVHLSDEVRFQEFGGFLPGISVADQAKILEFFLKHSVISIF